MLLCKLWQRRESRDNNLKIWSLTRKLLSKHSGSYWVQTPKFEDATIKIMIRKYILWYIDKQLGFQKKGAGSSDSGDMMPTSTSVAYKLMLNCYFKNRRDVWISEDIIWKQVEWFILGTWILKQETREKKNHKSCTKTIVHNTKCFHKCYLLALWVYNIWWSLYYITVRAAELGQRSTLN